MTERIELTPDTCPGYHEYDYQRQVVKAHIFNKCFNPSKGFDMEYF